MMAVCLGGQPLRASTACVGDVPRAASSSYADDAVVHHSSELRNSGGPLGASQTQRLGLSAGP